jgi:hypothetical protein
MVLSKVVATIPFEGNGIGDRMATAPQYSRFLNVANVSNKTSDILLV